MQWSQCLHLEESEDASHEPSEMIFTVRVPSTVSDGYDTKYLLRPTFHVYEPSWGFELRLVAPFSPRFGIKETARLERKRLEI